MSAFARVQPRDRCGCLDHG